MDEQPKVLIIDKEDWLKPEDGIGRAAGSGDDLSLCLGWGYGQGPGSGSGMGQGSGVGMPITDSGIYHGFGMIIGYGFGDGAG